MKCGKNNTICVANHKLKFAMFFSKTERMHVGHAICACISHVIA